VDDFSHRSGYRVQMMRAVAAAMLQVALASPLAAQDRPAPTPPPDSTSDGEEHRVFVMDDRPGLRFGDALRLDLTTKVDFELRHSPDLPVDTTEMERRRIGVDGRVFDFLGFQIEGDFADDERPWRDVFVEFRQWRALRVRGGRFKIPFGQERLTSISDIEFANRSIASAALTPGRDTGVEVNGRLFGRGLNYNAGVFRHDGDVSRDGTDAPGGRTVAARVVGTPLGWTRAPMLQRLELGVGATVGDVPEGLNGLRALSTYGFEAAAPVYVNGRRVRLGADAAFTQGPLALRAEFLQVRDARERQGLSDQDLPDVVGRGWYVSASSFVLGRLRGNGAPRRPVLGGGIGAVQLAARFESLSFSSDADGEPALRNPRAARIMSNDMRGTTLGVNWYPVRFVKVQFNVIREHLQDPERRPDPSRSTITSSVLRLQFAL
jgi:phosphate-selective porin OprO/OprP